MCQESRKGVGLSGCRGFPSEVTDPPQTHTSPHVLFSAPFPTPWFHGLRKPEPSQPSVLPTSSIQETQTRPLPPASLTITSQPHPPCQIVSCRLRRDGGLRMLECEGARGAWSLPQDACALLCCRDLRDKEPLDHAPAFFPGSARLATQ